MESAVIIIAPVDGNCAMIVLAESGSHIISAVASASASPQFGATTVVARLRVSAGRPIFGSIV